MEQSHIQLTVKADQSKKEASRLQRLLEDKEDQVTHFEQDLEIVKAQLEAKQQDHTQIFEKQQQQALALQRERQQLQELQQQWIQVQNTSMQDLEFRTQEQQEQMEQQQHVLDQQRISLDEQQTRLESQLQFIQHQKEEANITAKELAGWQERLEQKHWCSAI